MTPPLEPDAWRRVNELFHRAFELVPSARLAFLQEACPDSAEIRDEVLALLAADGGTNPLTPDAVWAGRTSGHGAPLPAGHVVGQYRINRVLGEGGMGVVYEAEDTRLGRLVALKAVALALARDQSRRERLRREARAAAALSHPGIATVYALEEVGDDLYIAGEFVPGETLRDEIARGASDAAVVIETAIELADALAAAHDRGVVHRDLKPENVMRAPSGRVKILDFGLATFRESAALVQLTGDGAVLGTPAYMSPEQIRRETLDGRSDLFSLGILLFELLTGEHPFGRADGAAMIARILEREPALPNSGSLRPSGSSSADGRERGLRQIIRTLLRKAPAARFASAHELARVLERLRAGHILAAQPESVADPTAQQWWRFHVAIVCTAYAVLLIPAWFARHAVGDDFGLPLFLVAAVAAAATIAFRLHLWFAATTLPGEWAVQHARSRWWLRAADLTFVGTLIALGLAVLRLNSVLGVILEIGAVVALVGATIIEPATTRAAFPPARRDRPAN